MAVRVVAVVEVMRVVGVMGAKGEGVRMMQEASKRQLLAILAAC